MATDNEWIEEEALATLLGVPRAFLKKMRADLAPDAVEAAPGKSVRLKKNAARNALVVFGLTFEWPEDAPSAPPEPPSVPEELTVVRRCRNPHMVTCKRANGDLVHVKVTKNDNYRDKNARGEPMRLKAQKVPGNFWWQHLGRDPRFPGFW